MNTKKKIVLDRLWKLKKNKKQPPVINDREIEQINSSINNNKFKSFFEHIENKGLDKKYIMINKHLSIQM